MSLISELQKRQENAEEPVEKNIVDPTWKSTQKKTEHGGKARHVESDRDRIHHYRKFRDTIGAPPYPSDIDFVEYVFVNGKVVPVAILEFTTLNWGFRSEETKKLFLKKVWTRWSKSDAQRKFTLEMARLLGVRPYLIVLSPPDKELFFIVTPLDKGPKWVELTPRKYKLWIKSLAKRASI